MKKKYVYLGRFSPFHKGHQATLDIAIANYGLENVMVMIGSSNSYNSRTPYTYDERKEMIQTVYPDLEIIPLPDMNPSLIYFDGSTNEAWLANLKKIEMEMDAEFTFVGGSSEDLAVLALGFPTKMMVDRKMVGPDLSATRVREAMDKNDLISLKKMLDSRVVSLAISGYTKFKKTL